VVSKGEHESARTGKGSNWLAHFIKVFKGMAASDGHNLERQQWWCPVLSELVLSEFDLALADVSIG